MAGGWKGSVKDMLRRASSHRSYRRVGAALVRRNPRRLFLFTQCSQMYSVQSSAEFVPFLELVMRRAPRSVLEIGTAHGGTFFMLCQAAAPDASLTTVDVRLPSEELIRSFARAHQTVVPLEGDSKASDIRARVAALFPTGLDLLFIDGDHSLDGVAADFDAYEPLVRPGGLVVFHDIVEDNLQRTGVSTGGWAGGVPQYWQQFKARAGGTWTIQEFVRSWEQDGLGIGVATKPA
jgi:predicted O-methyltransferase YrrM